MRFLRDDLLFRRAIGISIVFGLAGAGARHWRDDMIADGNYAHGNYVFAGRLLDVTWTIAVVALLYIATCLIISPRDDPKAVRKSADWYE